MTMLKVQIVSKESIKPSSPTPSHLRAFDLSFIDQMAPPVYVPILLFYANNGDNNMQTLEECRRLKTSLSEALTSFYPVAGRINNNVFIECNDEGVDYLEARVNAQLSDVIMEPNVNVLQTFLPHLEPHFDEFGYGSGLLLAIQVNVFDCGGIVISVCMSHKIADTTSTVTFINCWAAKACNANQAIHPIPEMSSLFPQRDLNGFIPSSWIYRGDLVTKRFVLDSASIASLKAKASNSSYVTCPSRVEAVSAFIWGRFMELAKSKEHVKACVALHTVNLRGRMAPPPLPVEGPNNTLGNLLTIVSACQEMESKKELHVLARKLRDAIKGVDCEFVRKMQCGEDEQFDDSLTGNLERVQQGEVASMMFTSWLRFPLYEADFGWGKPTWVSTTGMPNKNLVILIDTPSGDGIEAWVNMLEEDMVEFEQDKELLAFVSKIDS